MEHTFNQKGVYEVSTSCDKIACIAAKGLRKHMQDEVDCSELYLGDNYGNPGTSIKWSLGEIM